MHVFCSVWEILCIVTTRSVKWPVTLLLASFCNTRRYHFHDLEFVDLVFWQWG